MQVTSLFVRPNLSVYFSATNIAVDDKFGTHLTLATQILNVYLSGKHIFM